MYCRNSMPQAAKGALPSPSLGPTLSISASSTKALNCLSVLYSHLFCASINKMCLKVSEKHKRAHEGVMLGVKLDIFKCVDVDE